MAKVFWKGSTLLAPVPPTMVSCGTMEKPNIITVAWTGIVNSQPPMTYISVRPSRYSYELIKQSGEFVINLTPASLVRQADWCGVKSGREVDKFEACKLTPIAANQVSAPLIAECPINLECRVRSVTPLGSHDMFLADIVGVNVDEQYLDENGKPQLLQMGCYGIGISRLLGAAIEQGHDDKGIIWPDSIAPFTVVICPVGYDKSEEVQKASNELYGRLREAGIDVILDDRGLRPGVMFADWELIGVPHRVTIGDRGLKNGEVEYAHRGDLQNENVPVTEIADKLIAKIKVR